MLRGCGKGKRLGRKKYSLRPCLSFLCFSYRLSPPPSVTEYFSPWPISGQKVLDSDKTVYKDVLKNRLLCPPPAYPIANHFVVLYVFVFDHIQPTTLIIFDHKSWPQWIILDLYQSERYLLDMLSLNIFVIDTCWPYAVQLACHWLVATFDFIVIFSD